VEENNAATAERRATMRHQTKVQTRLERNFEVAKQERDRIIQQAEDDVGQALFDYAQIGKESAAGVAKRIRGLIEVIIANHERRP
jgi:hypothetical protein